jgi:hypothetical protein
MIAYHFGYKYIQLTSLNHPSTLEWYDSQDFIEENPEGSSYEFYYETKEKDQYYNRAILKGECCVIESSDYK